MDRRDRDRFRDSEREVELEIDRYGHRCGYRYRCDIGVMFSIFTGSIFAVDVFVTSIFVASLIGHNIMKNETGELKRT